MIVSAQITINASAAAVWAATTDIAHFAELLSGVQQIEVVEKPASGLVGLKWKETRILFGKPATVEKWITEVKERDHYITRAEQDGFVFITTNRVAGSDGNVTLIGIHETRPQGFAAKLKSLPMVFFKGMIKKAIMQDLKDIKKAVEKRMIDLRTAFPIEDPAVTVPWDITADELIQLFASFSPRRVTHRYITLPVRVLGGLHCMLGFHFQDQRGLSELEFYRTAYPDLRASFEEFQRYFEQAFGPPLQKEAGDAGFNSYTWHVPGASIIHFVLDRFGPEEHMRIKRANTTPDH